MRICRNPLCRLEILEDAVCACGADNSGAELAVEAVELEIAADTIGGTTGAILREEAEILEAEAVLDVALDI